MAVLSDTDRFSAWADFMRANMGMLGTLTKSELRAAVDGIDTWLNDNAASANQAIPQPARTALSTVQKAQLLTHVVHKRYLSGA